MEVKKELVKSYDLTSLNGLDVVNNSFQPKGKNYIYFLNKGMNTLYKFNFKDFLFRKVCSLGDMSGDFFSINDFQKTISIQHEDSIYLYNFKAQLLNKCYIPEVKDGYLYSSQSFPLSTFNDTSYFFNFYANIPDAYKEKEFFNKPIEAMWNTKKNKITKLPVGYPTTYKENCYGTMYLPQRVSVDKNEFIYFFNHSDTVYHYNTQTSKKTSYNISTRVDKQFLKIPFDSLAEYNESVYSDMFFKGSVYLFNGVLANNNITYRAFCPNKDSEKTLSKWIITLYDKNFNYIGETDELNEISNLFDDTSNNIYNFSIRDKKIKCEKVLFTPL